jgi:FkbM family methyltransferase
MIITTILKSLTKILSKSYYITQAAREIVRIYDNDGNADIEKNGEKGLLKYFTKLTDENSIVIDVGANVGDWSGALIEAGYIGKIFLIDPLQKNTEKLGVKFIGYKNIKISKCAMSENSGKLNFYTNTNDSLSGHDSLFDMREIGYKEPVREVEVEANTLDLYAEENKIKSVDFIKIDVEGNELSVLKGCAGLLTRHSIDFIQIEFGHAARAARYYLHDIFNLLKKLPYEVYIIKPNGLMKLSFSPFIENRYSYVNLLIAKHGHVNRLKVPILAR